MDEKFVDSETLERGVAYLPTRDADRLSYCWSHRSGPFFSPAPLRNRTRIPGFGGLFLDLSELRLSLRCQHYTFSPDGGFVEQGPRLVGM